MPSGGENWGKQRVVIGIPMLLGAHAKGKPGYPVDLTHLKATA